MKALGLIAASMLCWAIMEVFGASADVSGYQVVWTRYGTHLLWMIVLFAPRHGTKLVRSSHSGWHVFHSLLMLGMPLFFLWSVERITFRNTMAVFWFCPPLIIILAKTMGDSSSGVQRGVAAIPGFLGALLIYRPDARVFQPGVIFALGMALCFAMYLIVSRSMKEEFTLCRLFHTGLWVFAPLSLGLPLFWRTPSIRSLACMIAIGILGWFGLFALDRAVELASPVYLAPMLYTQLLWSAVIDSVAGGYRPGPRILAALLLVSCGAGAALFRGLDHATTSDRLIGYSND
jgi:drug/metabolite transporter (DMT)-like permease